MTSRRQKKAAVPKGKAKDYRSVADNFYEGAEMARAYEYWNAAGVLIVHSAILVFWLLAAAPGLRADERVLAAFPREEVPISRWLEANGWTSKRDDPGRWSVGEGVLNMVSENDSVLIGTE